VTSASSFSEIAATEETKSSHLVDEHRAVGRIEIVVNPQIMEQLAKTFPLGVPIDIVA
jgi:hypothetical protein